MKTGRLLAPLALAAMAAAFPARAAEPAGLAPFQMVRSLQLVQDRIAAGDHAAMPMQRKLLEMIDARLRQADADTFSDRRNMRGLLVYAMSGGNPVTVEVVLSRLPADDPDRPAGAAILNYLRGQPAKASAAFAAIDPRAADPEVAAPLALVKGALVALETPGPALDLFDFARLVSPGTLVEEAALRRSIALAAGLGDKARFLRHSEQYVRRFLRSPYATQFAEAFVAGAVSFARDLAFAELEPVIALMTEEQQRVIYLRIARFAAIEGLSELSAMASAAALAIRKEGPGRNDPRAALYASISSVTSETVDEVLAELEAIDASRLSAGDRKLLDAAKAIAASVLSAPSGDGAAAGRTADAPLPAVEPAPAPAALPAEAQAAEEADPFAASIDETRKKIAAIDALLGNEPR